MAAHPQHRSACGEQLLLQQLGPIDELYTVVEGNYYMDTCTSADDNATGAFMVPTSDTQSYCESVLVQLHREHKRGAAESTAAKAYEASATLSLSSSNFGVGDLDAVDGSSSSSTTTTATISTTASSTVTSTASSGPASTASAASSAAYTVSSNTTTQETSYALSSSNAQAADDLTVNADASHVLEIAATDNSTASIASSQTSASSTNLPNYRDSYNDQLCYHCEQLNCV
ncbi:hypothetical protein GQ600_9218 [Phytophthora cactorum]|nr:hypothetical protein GQ600_9218 [Phytophthora cactorum]